MIIGVFLFGAGIFYDSLYNLVALSIRDPMFSHALLIPMVSLYFFWMDRKHIFSEVVYAPYRGAGLMAISVLVMFLQKSQFNSLSQTDTLSVQISCMVIWIMGGVVLICGWPSFKKALFPLLFLSFMIPLPSILLDPLVTFLQLGSAWSAISILKLLNVPSYSHGIFIALPGVTIEVAKECSGIRSGLALLILCSVVCYMFLKSHRRRVILAVSVIPVTIFKNGMRIATLALLGTYVDIHYLTNSVLHSYGGKPFFLVAILMLTPIFWMLKRAETKADKKKELAKNGQPLSKVIEISKDFQVT